MRLQGRTRGSLYSSVHFSIGLKFSPKMCFKTLPPNRSQPGQAEGGCPLGSPVFLPASPSNPSPLSVGPGPLSQALPKWTPLSPPRLPAPCFGGSSQSGTPLACPTCPPRTAHLSRFSHLLSQNHACLTTAHIPPLAPLPLTQTGVGPCTVGGSVLRSCGHYGDTVDTKRPSPCVQTTLRAAGCLASSKPATPQVPGTSRTCPHMESRQALLSLALSSWCLRYGREPVLVR